MEEKLKAWIMNTDITIKNKNKVYDKHDTFESLYDEVFNKENSWMNLGICEKLKATYEYMEEHHIYDYMNKNNINVVTYDEADYPQMLKVYDDSPFGLFYKGDISIINCKKNLSVIGSRRCTRYGLDATEHIINELKPYDVNIISGMARGIDSCAHRSAIANNLKTVAILGSGVDIVYPKENKFLYEEIVNSGGCVISEFPIGTGPISYNFPIRNRIISGIGNALLVIEGGEKSGTLITVGTALDQGKDVIVVPGSIFALESKGTNKLINHGASPYNTIHDILDVLHISYGSINNNDMFTKNSLEDKLFNIIDDNPIHIDNIIKLTHIDINQLYKLLFELQAKKEILCLSGNFYVRINNMKSKI